MQSVGFLLFCCDVAFQIVQWCWLVKFRFFLSFAIHSRLCKKFKDVLTSKSFLITNILWTICFVVDMNSTSVSSAFICIPKPCWKCGDCDKLMFKYEKLYIIFVTRYPACMVGHVIHQNSLCVLLHSFKLFRLLYHFCFYYLCYTETDHCHGLSEFLLFVLH